ncbi:hypothetical protein [Bacillus multifaciens]|uniref:hypothetical protein n=1 Tax=Bacillus multifaciens TaxID=3068506 RepID=UPI002740FBAF|nr:hypothetical protein [Bacillus sp. WLY-B-L8]MDP7978975.1 hypothetical protein [Bacillus sp. WLY-B-L8]
MQNISEYNFSDLLGQSVKEINPEVKLPLIIVFDDGCLTVECAWRIRNLREVQVGKPDYELTNQDGSRFRKIAKKLLRNRKVQKVHHFSPISDLTIEFDENIFLDIFHDSSFFEGWQLSIGDDLHISLPGGSLG